MFFSLLEIEHCDPNPCLHGGTCKENNGKFVCSCIQDWKGSICESEFKDSIIKTQPILTVLSVSNCFAQRSSKGIGDLKIDVYGKRQTSNISR